MQNATQNIVDAFLTRDGLDINDDRELFGRRICAER